MDSTPTRVLKSLCKMLRNNAPNRLVFDKIYSILRILDNKELAQAIALFEGPQFNHERATLLDYRDDILSIALYRASDLRGLKTCRKGDMEITGNTEIAGTANTAANTGNTENAGNISV